MKNTEKVLNALTVYCKEIIASDIPHGMMRDKQTTDRIEKILFKLYKISLSTNDEIIPSGPAELEEDGLHDVNYACYTLPGGNFSIHYNTVCVYDRVLESCVAVVKYRHDFPLSFIGDKYILIKLFSMDYLYKIGCTCTVCKIHGSNEKFIESKIWPFKKTPPSVQREDF